MRKANPTPADNMEEYLMRFVKTFALDSKDISRVEEMRDVHMASAEANDQDSVNWAP